jgi:hypothetical protein
MSDKQQEANKGCWSTNNASGYFTSILRWKGRLQNAIEELELGNVHGAIKETNGAVQYMNETERSFARANVEFFRIQALKQEVAALRSGIGVTHAAGRDPMNDDWEFLPFDTSRGA